MSDPLRDLKRELLAAAERQQRHAGPRRRRRVFMLAAAALVVVVGTASAIGSVRDLFSGDRRIAAAWLTGAASWSPDGRRIAFVTIGCDRWCSGPVELNLMNADGTGQRNLTREWGLERASPFPAAPAVWSPDWRKVALVQQRGPARGYPVYGRYSDIYVLNADGSGRRRLTHSPQNDGDPVWSPDGRKIAFVRVDGGLADIYVVNADGSGLRRLAHAIAFTPMPGGPGGGWRASPAWSPDGRRIAFVSNRRGNFDIFVVNADGDTGLRKLSRSPRNDYDPAWSPDGRAIAFQGRREPPPASERGTCPLRRCERQEMYVVDANGGEVRRLTRDWRFDAAPVWSPDGRKILFEHRHHPDIWVMNADGSGRRNLTLSATQPFASDGAPAWSPDGRKILFLSNRGDGNWFEVYVMNADGSGKRKLTQLKGGD
jgi:TolB protein